MKFYLTILPFVLLYIFLWCCEQTGERAPEPDIIHPDDCDPYTHLFI